MAQKVRLDERRVEKVDILENETNDGRVRFRAIVSEGDHINKNGRMYPMSVLWPAFEQVNAHLNRYPGAVDHPDPWEGVKVGDIGIKWEGFERDPMGSLIYGIGRTVNTHRGQDLAAVIADELEIGFSTRTLAAGREELMDGRSVYIIEEMDPPFVDAVTNPSVGHARVQSFTREEVEMEKELQEALEAKHKAETALAVTNATVELRASLGESEAKLAAAEAKLTAANERIAALEGQIAESAKATEADALTAKLTALTADDRFGPTIVARARAYKDLSLDNVEGVVEMARGLVEDMASIRNENVDAAPKGDLTTDEDKPAEKTEEVSGDPDIVALLNPKRPVQD